MKRPLMLWCSSHRTLSQEEIPLFLESGFRVIPLLTDFWTLQYDEKLDANLCSDWKQNVELPPDVIKQLQSLSLCVDNGCLPFRRDEIDLLNRYVDVIYMTVLPNLAIRLTKVFKGMVIFRPFGHAGLNTYSKISEYFGTKIEELNGKANFYWVPILTTLQELSLIHI
ncbi:MAG: hypothetical protein MPJ25_16515, partial [Pirellulales bacterium]|nr:hypothetical protein [Pirellulales bacterium]